MRVLARGIVSGDVELLSSYLQQGGDPNAADNTGCTLLHEAANFDQPSIVRLLLEAGAEVDPLDRDRRAPLDLTPNRPHSGPMTVATPGGLRTYSQTPHSSNPSKALEVATLLLSAGASVERERSQRECFGLRTPVALACRNGDIQLVKLFLSHGADIEAQDEFLGTPLIDAVDGGHLKIVEHLLAAGAAPNNSDRRGQTPLLRSIYAAHRGMKESYLEITKRLLNTGADPNLATLDRGDSPLFAAINECREDLLTMVIKAGGQIDHQNKKGDTALCFLVKTLQSRKLDEEKMMLLASTLLSQGASKLVADSEGRTPAALARHFGFQKLSGILS